MQQRLTLFERQAKEYAATGNKEYTTHGTLQTKPQKHWHGTTTEVQAHKP
jgi:hypothetical protein